MPNDTYPYRSNDGLKLNIERSDPIRGSGGRDLFKYVFKITGFGEKPVNHFLEITDEYIISLGQNPDDANQFRENSKTACVAIITDMILQGELPNEESQTFELYRDSLDKRIRGTISTTQQTGKWIYTRDISTIIKENQIARRIALKSAYFLNSQGGSFSAKKFKKLCHYDDHAISNALKYFETASIIERHPDHRDIRVLTEQGQIKFERTYLRFSNSVFLIAACKTDIEDLIKNVYRPIVEDEFDLTLIFQENEEPHKSIHEDIYDYIDNCKFIIADLSHHRPNCYYELGYAVAKEKQVLVTISGTDELDKEGNPKIPFDVTPQRYTSYDSEHDLEKFKETLRVRIGIINSRLEIN